MQKYISHNQCVCWYHDLFDMTCVTGYKCRFWTSLDLIQMTLRKILEWQKLILQNHQEPDTTSHSMHELHSSQYPVFCFVCSALPKPKLRPPCLGSRDIFPLTFLHEFVDFGCSQFYFIHFQWRCSTRTKCSIVQLYECNKLQLGRFISYNKLMRACFVIDAF